MGWHEIIMWLWAEKLYIFALVIILFNRKSLWKFFVKDPITGGNGSTQPDELAKWILINSYVGMLFTHEAVQWPLTLYFMVLTAIIGIAKLDKVLEVLLAWLQSKKGGTKIDDNISEIK